ncbi:MAG: 4a-hydroxytetrahydrobiopterin dehydratase [Actinomycetes bacterium]
MTRPQLASPEELENWLLAHPGWRVLDGHLLLERSVPFRVAGALAAASVALADEIDHHPIMTIGFDSLRIEMWTHDKGGITELDFRLATFIDEFLATRR